MMTAVEERTMSAKGPMRRTVLVANPNGLHLRPATLFAASARGFISTVFVMNGNRIADGKNHWDLLKLVAMPGAELVLEIDGPDATEAVEPLTALLAAPGEED